MQFIYSGNVWWVRQEKHSMFNGKDPLPFDICILCNGQPLGDDDRINVVAMS